MAEEVKVQVPSGMTKEQVTQLFATFTKQRIETKARDKAIAQATKDLRTKYSDEYKALVTRYMPK